MKSYSKRKILSYVTTFFIITLTISARPVIIITYSNHQKRAEFAKTVLKKRLKIPDVLITISKKSHLKSCKKIKEAILQICFMPNGEIKFPTIKKAELNHAFLVFRQHKTNSQILK